MKTYSDLIVCNGCDTVYRRPSLARGETARCDECHATLHGAIRLDVDRWLALTVAAAIVYLIANVCPVIRIGLRSQHNEATLWQSAAALAHSAAAPIAVPIAMSVIVVPLLQIALLGWTLAYARAGRRAPGFATAMRLLVALGPWNMIEVALLGVLVSVVKLSGFMEVTPAIGLWAMAALMMLITLITQRDVRHLWDLDLIDSGTQA
ncbi:paraquat-inducible protein A [Paraburkholderia lacunae]|uniref:Paraquat-inducible membrane protein A n=1 Tax=Paraburkholderia lacunae TaxID=2211104 RepID=A0A370MYP3_9BURK|nr:paraquat-inducible protein A [Paraburkholderia lacunae]RDJ98436.1 paraquat-inducible membrane protein A [Paraburkholderia lacunae]